MPDSGVPAALGFAQACGIPYELGIIRNHYVGRTFIQPTQSVRELGVRLKHSANRAVVDGKRIVLVDDSIVRGTTSVKIVRMMREAGASEVHFRIASPPITHPDFYGIDTPEREKLLAATHDLEDMRAFIGADSLAFLSIDGLYRAMGEERRNPAAPQFTDHCFTGDYPTPLTDLAGRDAAPPRRCSPKPTELAPCRLDKPLAEPRRGRHRRLARHRPRRRARPRRRRRACRRAGPHAGRARGARRRDPRAWAAPRRSFRSTSRISTPSTASAPRSTSAGAGSTSSSAMPASSASSRRSPHVDQPIWDEVMAVNVTANWRLIRSLDPLLRASDAGRALFVTSGAAHKCTAYWGPYSVSKAALEALVRTYAAETATTPIRVMLVNPGPLRTRMRAAAMPGEDPQTLKTPEDLAPHFVRLASPDWTETGKIYDFPQDRLLTPQSRRLRA